MLKLASHEDCKGRGLMQVLEGQEEKIGAPTWTRTKDQMIKRYVYFVSKFGLKYMNSLKKAWN